MSKAKFDTTQFIKQHFKAKFATLAVASLILAGHTQARTENWTFEAGGHTGTIKAEIADDDTFTGTLSIPCCSGTTNRISNGVIMRNSKTVSFTRHLEGAERGCKQSYTGTKYSDGKLKGTWQGDGKWDGAQCSPNQSGDWQGEFNL